MAKNEKDKQKIIVHKKHLRKINTEQIKPIKNWG